MCWWFCSFLFVLLLLSVVFIVAVDAPVVDVLAVVVSGNRCSVKTNAHEEQNC